MPDLANRPSASGSSMPSTHIGPVRGLSSYEPASLADVPDNDDEADPARPSSPSTRLGKGRQSVDHQRRGSDWGSDDEDDGWDAWDDGGPTEDGPLRGGSREIRRSLDEDGGDGDMEQEMKDLEEAGREGAVSSEKELKKKLYWREAMITGFFVLLWYMFSTLISLYNKWVFGPKYFGFPFPMFMTFCQMIVQFCLASIVRFTMPEKFKPPNNPNLKDYGTRVAPTGVSTALDIGLSNLSLKTITLSLYTMCKSSSLIFVLFFAFLFRLEAFSWKLISVIGLITAGVVLMAFNTTAVDLPGAMLVFIASALGGLRWALTHALMIKQELGLTNPFATIFWITPVMAFTLAIVSMIEDGWSNVFGSEFFQPDRLLVTLILIIIPGLLAFAMVASEYYIIQRAGVVPLSVAGVFKEVTTISIASWAFGDELTPVNFAGLFVTMIGIVLFTHHKYQKAISSSSAGPVDSHGRPIRLSRSEEEGEGEESVPLNSMGRDEEERGSSREGGFLGGLFWNRRPSTQPYRPLAPTAPTPPPQAASTSTAHASTSPVEQDVQRPFMDPADKSR